MSEKKAIALIRRDMSVKGGGERVLCMVANALCEKYEVHVFSIISAHGRESGFPLDRRVNYHILAHGDVSMWDKFPKKILELRKFFRQKKVRVLIAFGERACFHTLLATIGTRTKSVYSEQSNLNNMTYRSKKRLLSQYIGSHWLDEMVTLTRRDMEAYQKQMKAKHVRSIYNWMDASLMEKTANGIYHGEYQRIVTVGRISPVKGYDLLLKTAKIIFEQMPDWTWHIYGGGNKLPQLQTQVEAAGLAEHVILEGDCDHIYDIYRDYSIYVLTSYHEGMPMVILEAKANRLPVVSFDCETGPREMIQDGVNGYLIPTYDTERMAEKLMTLMGSEELRRKMSEHARDDMEKFSRDQVVTAWEMLIEELSA